MKLFYETLSMLDVQNITNLVKNLERNGHRRVICRSRRNPSALAKRIGFWIWPNCGVVERGWKATLKYKRSRVIQEGQCWNKKQQSNMQSQASPNSQMQASPNSQIQHRRAQRSMFTEQYCCTNTKEVLSEDQVNISSKPSRFVRTSESCLILHAR